VERVVEAREVDAGEVVVALVGDVRRGAGVLERVPEALERVATGDVIAGAADDGDVVCGEAREAKGVRNLPKRVVLGREVEVREEVRDLVPPRLVEEPALRRRATACGCEAPPEARDAGEAAQFGLVTRHLGCHGIRLLRAGTREGPRSRRRARATCARPRLTLTPARSWSEIP